ncbi:hypothetical protein Vafri_4833 [Volvox africanus]|uniref:Uncharacterized protein n=1 Tax=Volvox africanus TaxID=51714 RepID=A0A8J4AUW3_9CHLO|nr:hypothetical protein Vafri_4833 [Volvox africanus]
MKPPPGGALGSGMLGSPSASSASKPSVAVLSGRDLRAAADGRRLNASGGIATLALTAGSAIEAVPLPRRRAGALDGRDDSWAPPPLPSPPMLAPLGSADGPRDGPRLP